MKSYLTPKQVSEKTGLKYSTVIKYGNVGIFPACIIRNGRKSKYLFPEKEIEKRLDSFRQEEL